LGNLNRLLTAISYEIVEGLFRGVSFLESSAIGDSTKDSMEGSSKGKLWRLETPKGATEHEQACGWISLRESWRALERENLFLRELHWGLPLGDLQGYGKEGSVDGYH
jgi:hypothetical protein